MTRTAMYSMLLCVLLTSGCGQRSTPETSTKPAAAPRRVRAHEDARATRWASVTSIVENGMDAVLKAMDDFSAALGAQYARFSYDTNRVLTAQYTNYLSRLPDAEFVDFVRDFTSAVQLRGITSNEFDLLHAVVVTRLAEFAQRGDMERYGSVADNMLSIAMPLRDQRATELAEQWITTAWKAAYAQRDLTHLVLAVGSSSCAETANVPEGHAERVLRLCRQLCDDGTLGLVSRKGYVRLQMITSTSESYLDPPRALERLLSIRDEVHRLFKDSEIEQPCAITDATIQGLQQGLRGRDLYRYVEQTLNLPDRMRQPAMHDASQ